MNIRQVIKTLEDQGHSITYYVRKDGGVLIKSIDGVKYQGATGNKIARWMAGQQLSEKRAKQLEKITTTGKRAKKTLTNETIKKKLREVQRKWNKAFPHKRGETPSVGLKTSKDVKWNLEHKGEEETIRLLNEAERYAEGIAYSENVKNLIDRITEVNEYYNSKELKDVISWINDNFDKIQENKMEKSYQILYLLNDGVSVEQVAQLLKNHFGIK